MTRALRPKEGTAVRHLHGDNRLFKIGPLDYDPFNMVQWIKIENDENLGM